MCNYAYQHWQKNLTKKDFSISGLYYSTCIQNSLNLEKCRIQVRWNVSILTKVAPTVGLNILNGIQIKSSCINFHKFFKTILKPS